MKTKEHSNDFIEKEFNEFLDKINSNVADFYGVDNLYLIKSLILKEILIEEQSRIISYTIKSKFDDLTNVKFIETIDLIKKEFFDPDDRINIIERIFKRVQEISGNNILSLDKDKIINLLK